MELIALYPWSNSFLDNKIFEIGNLYNLLPNCELYVESNPFKLLKHDFQKNDYNLVTIDQIDNIEKAKYIIFFDMPQQDNEYFIQCVKNNLYEKMVLFLWEPNVVKPTNYIEKFHKHFNIVFTWNDDLVDNNTYFKFNSPQPSKIVNPYKIPYGQKKLCTLIAGNKSSKIANELYSERLKVINFFEKNYTDDFEFYGRGWSRSTKTIKQILKSLTMPKYKTYKGESNNKLKTLSEYKFCICYENERLVNGYITEKIFDCFFAGTVPIYLGAENINDYIPKGCFVDRRNFNSYIEMYDFMKSIGEEEYLRYILNIKEYLTSDKFKQFTDRYFTENIISVLIQNN